MARDQHRPEDDWIFDPDLAAIDRSLNREMRAEAREIEESIATSELRNATFAEVALDARNRGDTVAIATQRRSFVGVLRYAARDFVTVVTANSEVDVSLTAIDHFRIVERGRRGGGQAMLPGSGSFEMRLLERESAHERVEVGFQYRDEVLLGTIPVVSQDHVTVSDGQRNQWIIPFTSIAFIVRQQRRMDRG